tara:strand:- start:9 stop:434 length:426 start_codon:yes stop_codon:yes gene_type:complete
MQKLPTINDVKFFNTKTMIEPDGNLVPIEGGTDIPFNIERIFYVYGVRDQNDRGKHSHYETEQVLICVSGKIEVLVDDTKNKKRFLLESPQQALYIPNMIWDEQSYLTEESVLLSICNTKYSEDDYIHDYTHFKELRKNQD